MPRAASTSSVRREHARSGRVQRSTANPRCPPQCSVRPTRKPRYVTIATRRSDAGGQKTQQQRKAQVTSGKSRFARLPFIMIDLIVGVMAEPHVAGGKGPPWRADDLDGGSTAMRLRRRYWLGWAGERARVTGKAAKARQGTCAGGDFLPPACSPHCANRCVIITCPQIQECPSSNLWQRPKCPARAPRLWLQRCLWLWRRFSPLGLADQWPSAFRPPSANRWLQPLGPRTPARDWGAKEASAGTA